jgi:hypothetical protein
MSEEVSHEEKFLMKDVPPCRDVRATAAHVGFFFFNNAHFWVVIAGRCCCCNGNLLLAYIHYNVFDPIWNVVIGNFF